MAYDEIEILDVRKEDRGRMAEVVYQIPEEYSDEPFPERKRTKFSKDALEKVELEDGTEIRKFEKILYDRLIKSEEEEEEVKRLAEECKKDCRGKKLCKDDKEATKTSKKRKKQKEKKENLRGRKVESEEEKKPDVSDVN